MSEKVYIAIDLKSFYASVECVERGLNPLDTNLVVADNSRTEKTICLAVSPSLKSFGISGRARLFEVIQRVKEINATKLSRIPERKFGGKTYNFTEYNNHPDFALDYITATPRMSYYIEYSTKIYDIYLRYIAPEDIHVYSIDEVFIDATNYMWLYKMSPKELAMRMINDVLRETGITATAGIGTNMYLCKVAMDIVAKKMPADENGVRIAELNERSYRELLWNHQPLTDFWRIGSGYSKKLRQYGIYTMGDIARCSCEKKNPYYNEELLYKLFGINAELLIDHAWGWEPCTIEEVKSYKPESKSLSSGQVLKCPYKFHDARLIVREVADQLSLDLVKKGIFTNQLTLTIGYDRESLTSEDIIYTGEVTCDHYGRKIPKHAHGTVNLKDYCSSTNIITNAVISLFDQIVDSQLLVRRINICACKLVTEEKYYSEPKFEQVDLFSDYENLEKERLAFEREMKKEKRMQEAMIYIRERFGKNAVIKAMNLQENATAIERNGQIGGHRA